MKKPLAWHDDKKLKDGLVSKLEEHRRLEHLTQGVGFEDNGQIKGCNIGCLFGYYDHAKGAKESGIPEEVLRLADKIFEGLPKKQADDFAIEWPMAIKIGVDLSKFKWQFCAFLMRENIERVLLLDIPDKIKKEVVESIRGVLRLHENAAKNRSAWIAAASAARSAESAASAARSAESAAWSAARSAESAAWSAWIAAESTAWSARSAASAAWSARSAAYIRYAKEFVRLCEEIK